MTDYQKHKLIILSVLGIIFLFISYNYSRNGRYLFNEQSTIVLDTRSGTIYYPGLKKYLDLNDFTKRK